MNENSDVEEIEKKEEKAENASGTDNDIKKYNSDPSGLSKIEEVLKEKQNISGNYANNMQIIYNSTIIGDNSNGSFGIREMHIDKSNSNPEQTYRLNNDQELIEFVETHGGDEYYVNAVVLCVFDYVLTNDLQNLKKKLEECLPPKYDNAGNIIYSQPQHYISIDNILKVFNGKIFIESGGERCVGLGSDIREKAMELLWLHFPYIRDSVAKWLVSIVQKKEFNTRFKVDQIKNAFVNIIKLDVKWGIDNLISRLCYDSEHYWLLGLIVIDLYKSNDYYNYVDELVIKWMSSYDSWLWKPAALIFSKLEESQMSSKLLLETKKRLNLVINKADNEDIEYLGMLLFGSKFFRTYITTLLNEIYKKCKSNNERMYVGSIYLQLLANSYCFISKSKIELPLVVCDNKKQLLDLKPLINQICKIYPLKRSWFNIILAYFREISYYNFDDKIVSKLGTYLGFSMQNNPIYKNDIYRMLDRSKCKIADLVLLYCHNHNI